MSIVQRVGPVLKQAIAAVINRADHRNTVSITAALNHVRQAAPELVASNDAVTEAHSRSATSLGLFVAFESASSIRLMYRELGVQKDRVNRRPADA
ncbi:MAG: hypothetical protein E5Y32_30315 [Mesorhizobium sp.]|nr:MAG: hypothetical protein E5Y32_30315 [Mesorhizobium sp.]